MLDYVIIQITDDSVTLENRETKKKGTLTKKELGIDAELFDIVECEIIDGKRKFSLMADRDSECKHAIAHFSVETIEDGYITLFNSETKEDRYYKISEFPFSVKQGDFFDLEIVDGNEKFHFNPKKTAKLAKDCHEQWEIFIRKSNTKEYVVDDINNDYVLIKNTETKSYEKITKSEIPITISIGDVINVETTNDSKMFTINPERTNKLKERQNKIYQKFLNRK